MVEKPVAPAILRILLAVAILTPIAVLLLVALAVLLGAMSDAIGQAVVNRLALALGVGWLLDLICLLLATAANLLAERTPDDR